MKLRRAKSSAVVLLTAAAVVAASPAVALADDDSGGGNWWFSSDALITGTVACDTALPGYTTAPTAVWFVRVQGGDRIDASLTTDPIWGSTSYSATLSALATGGEDVTMLMQCPASDGVQSPSPYLKQVHIDQQLDPFGSGVLHQAQTIDMRDPHDGDVGGYMQY